MALQQLSHTKAPHGVVRKGLDEGIDDDLGHPMGAFAAAMLEALDIEEIVA